MIALVWAAVIVLAACLILLFGAQVEQFEQLKQLRQFLDLEDKTMPVTLERGAGLLASEVGLPAEMDKMSQARVLFLSTRCSTCVTLAASMRGGKLPDNLTWIAIVPVAGHAEDFIQKFDLRGDRILIDQGELISSAIGLDVTPSAVRIVDGRLVDAHTVPSIRTLRATSPGKSASPGKPAEPRLQLPHSKDHHDREVDHGINVG